ncbi:MAG: glycosyltransferase [Wenzhouxiangellaceae bacterium]|nr:glycosyltransferase [Wenzhouxiangellaceae bacterium]
MSRLRVLILGEHPPPDPEQPAAGLALRHWRMARTWAADGIDVTFAWTARTGDGVANDTSIRTLALESERALESLPPFDVAVLGYWELAAWLPEGAARIVLDYVAPRILERHVEDIEATGDELRRLVGVLAGIDEIWVGHARQADLLLPLLMQAGHDCRDGAPVRVVPIAGEPAGEPPARRPGRPLRLFHGGREWPWRRSGTWLEAVRDRAEGRWELVELTERDGLRGHAAYLEALAGCDLLLDVAEPGTERRYAQSFRVVDALCAGVPVVCPDFQPVAPDLERRGAGWSVADPEALVALLERFAEDPQKLVERRAGALALAREHFDAERVYGRLGEVLAELPRRRPAERPRLAHAPISSSRAPGWRAAVAEYADRWVHHRLRLPYQRRMKQRLAHRPKPSIDPANDRAAWVVVSRPDLFPTDHGAAVKIERTAWGLSFHVGEVVLLTDRRDVYWVYRDGEREQRRFPLGLRLRGWPRALNIVRLMAKGLPYSNAFLYLPLVDRSLKRRLAWLLQRHPVEVVQGEFPAYAQLAVWAQELCGTRSLLVEHNVEYLRIAEQVPALTPAGREMLKRVEIDVANACDRVVCVSERDRELLVSGGVRPGHVDVIPHGVDLEAFARAEPVDARARYGIPADHAVIAYHGIYSYAPNLEAVEELATRILPALAERGHPATVLAVGPRPPERAPHGVVFTGAVDDLAGTLKAADLAVVPLRQGGGTRMKILDDFAAGLPVVATPKGAEGIDVADGEQILIAEDAESIVAAVAGLLEDGEARAAQARRAFEWVSDFDWRAIAGRYVERMRAGDRRPG